MSSMAGAGVPERARSRRPFDRAASEQDRSEYDAKVGREGLGGMTHLAAPVHSSIQYPTRDIHANKSCLRIPVILLAHSASPLVSRRQTVNACLFGLDRRRHLYMVCYRRRFTPVWPVGAIGNRSKRTGGSKPCLGDGRAARPFPIRFSPVIAGHAPALIWCAPSLARRASL